ncbi:MarR family winged helix-turn-helix transcriptional regulator [Bosea sp. BH3]|uniref:MarR family winged helix-turn-helix transcriptional regulator n=1 Tax=Bosea sp. BH3 TaxID=2871701 RepID=UPI0021CAFFAA|nr:MarR family transcriptional regulator [Bosea sp. BH3]MCU4179910.1 MarR family transcriptional regulator [Bosea sp. BH3]
MAALPSQLTDHLGYWLRLVSNQVSLSFARRVEDRGVTVGEWVLLREVYEVDRIAPIRLSERMGMTRGAISKLAERLIAKGLLLRRDDERDARGQWLSLTAAGRDLVPALAALADENDAAFFDTLSVSDRAELDRLLKLVAQRHGLKDPPVS